MNWQLFRGDLSENMTIFSASFPDVSDQWPMKDDAAREIAVRKLNHHFKNLLTMSIGGTVALVMWSQQKLHCRLFRQPTDKIVLQVTIYHCANVDTALYVSCESARCQPAGSVSGEMI